MGKWDGGKLYWFFFYFLNCCVCVIYGCWEEYGKEKKKYDYWMRMEYNF